MEKELERAQKTRKGNAPRADQNKGLMNKNTCQCKPVKLTVASASHRIISEINTSHWNTAEGSDPQSRCYAAFSWGKPWGSVSKDGLRRCQISDWHNRHHLWMSPKRSPKAKGLWDHKGDGSINPAEPCHSLVLIYRCFILFLTPHGKGNNYDRVILMSFTTSS